MRLTSMSSSSRGALHCQPALRTLAIAAVSIAILCTDHQHVCSAFIPLSISHAGPPNSASTIAADRIGSIARACAPLSMARRSANTKTNGKKKKKNGGKNFAKKKGDTMSKGKGKDAQGRDPLSDQQQQWQEEQKRLRQQQPKKKAVAPPWQVVSQKDMKKQVKAEKERRQMAQEGQHQSPMEAQQAQAEFTLSSSFLDPADKALLAWKRYSPSQKQHDTVDFVGAYLDRRLPDRLGVPEIAFLGRSNVGKSSLLNKLVSSDAARVGKTPGATAAVNLYCIKRKQKPVLGLADLPGFGYAKLSKETKEAVQEAAENYLGRRKELALGILLVDIRREPSEDDRAVLAALFDMGVPIVVVATKTDKLSATQLTSALVTIRDGLGLPEGQPFSVSSVTGRGVKELWKIIMEACEERVMEYRKEKLKDASDPWYSDDGFDAENEEEVGYDMGYDWVHDSQSVMYEGDSTDHATQSGGQYHDGENAEYYDEGYDGDDGYYDDEDLDGDEYYDDASNMESKPMTIQSLRKKAKEMEKQGKV